MPLFGIFETPLLVGMVTAGAASVPIVIHLLNRRRFRIVPWAAMRFLLAAQKKNTRRMRLEQLLLLAVRTLLVLLLVLAMASVMPWSESLFYRFFPEAQFAPPAERAHPQDSRAGRFVQHGHENGRTDLFRKGLRRRQPDPAGIHARRWLQRRASVVAGTTHRARAVGRRPQSC